MAELRIGILADTAVQQHCLRTVIQECGYTVGNTLILEQFQASNELVVSPLDNSDDAWLVDVNLAGPKAQQLDAWLDQIDVPVIFGDGSVPNPGAVEFDDWSRRLTGKVEQLVGTINLQQTSEPSANHVWVLAASTGGPEAVKEFLTHLPPALGVSFIYVQHIESDFDKTLAQVMNKDSAYPAAVACHGDVLEQNAVAIVASATCVEVMENGTLVSREGGWRGPFSPSIDQVVANVARIYHEHAGVIIFSGMGDDGAVSSRLMRQQGGLVWAQSPDTCACSSMPDSAIATESVGFMGSPAQLAQQLQQQLKQR